MGDIGKRIRSNPLGFLKRAFSKLIVGPLRYRRGGGYDAERYWGDRFRKYGCSLRASGHEGLSERQNEEMYRAAAETFKTICARQGIEFGRARVLEVGCGVGFYTALLRDLGVERYVGMDITDELFPELRREFPDYRFVKGDVCADAIAGAYDVVVMIDVTEHIVEEDKLAAALANIRSALVEGGTFILGQPDQKSDRPLFYLRFWSMRDITNHFTNDEVGEPLAFRRGYLLPIRKRGLHSV